MKMIALLVFFARVLVVIPLFISNRYRNNNILRAQWFQYLSTSLPIIELFIFIYLIGLWQIAMQLSF